MNQKEMLTEIANEIDARVEVGNDQFNMGLAVALQVVIKRIEILEVEDSV